MQLEQFIHSFKTHCIHFSTNNIGNVERDIGYLDKLITASNQIKFLGLTINCILTWDKHVDEIMRKLNSVCYLMRMSLNTLKVIYHSLFHSVMSYGLIFWDNSSYADRVVRIMLGCGYRQSCRDLFKVLNILPLKSQYIYSPMLFVVKNRDCFVPNSECHGFNTRQTGNLHLSQVNLCIERVCTIQQLKSSMACL